MKNILLILALATFPAWAQEPNASLELLSCHVVLLKADVQVGEVAADWDSVSQQRKQQCAAHAAVLNLSLEEHIEALAHILTAQTSRSEQRQIVAKLVGFYQNATKNFPHDPNSLQQAYESFAIAFDYALKDPAREDQQLETSGALRPVLVTGGGALSAYLTLHTVGLGLTMSRAMIKSMASELACARGLRGVLVKSSEKYTAWVDSKKVVLAVSGVGAATATGLDLLRDKEPFSAVQALEAVKNSDLSAGKRFR